MLSRASATARQQPD
ncbi:hypothetical protein ANANG_G00296410 [Anguilla anguilla]|uniref:Uncharacterized protein n=1 Tax=Anguilla anguilla TaxID=7936 RepID=A0A9D3LNV9_ANGAN|nr:hypothetical protein ANANG_G00296410 [Anguilla anguilla]